MPVIRLPALFLAFALLSGCTQYVWVKPLGNPATYPGDSYACKQESMAAAPPAFQTYEPYWPNDYEVVRLHCAEGRHHERCRAVIAERGYSPPPHTVDLNQGNRQDLFNSCMNARGWQLQAVENPE